MATSSHSRNRGLWLCPLTALFWLSCASAHAQSKPSEPRQARIVLRILDGKTGWPIWAEVPNVWLAGAISPIDPPPKTNWRGEIKLDVPAAGTREIRFMPNWYIDCRSSNDQMGARKVKYSIEEILEQGIVAENVCSKTKAKPVPGVLTLYVRPRTWQEIMEL